MKQKTEYFTRFPNDYIQGNIKSKYGISRKFYITYILIDKYRSYEDYSWITIRKVLDFYGYKTHRNKPKAFKEILDVLEYMINNKMIEVKQDLDSIGYDTGIEIKIIPDNFDFGKDFSKLTSSQFDFIMMNPPFGREWKSEKNAVETEAKKGVNGRFPAGTPAISDSQLLFLENAVSKMKPEGSKIAIIHNGSALFKGDAGSGESEIRRYVIENDLLDCII